MSGTQIKTLKTLPFLIAAVLSYVGAFLLRFEFTVPRAYDRLFLLGLCIFLPLKGIVYWMFRLYAGRWRLASLLDLYRIATANLTASALLWVLTPIIVGSSFPRSISVIDGLLCFLVTAGMPSSVRLYWEVFVPKTSEGQEVRMVLVYGAGIAGSMLSREIRSNTRLRSRIVGFLDDDGRKHTSSLDGIPILGAGRDVVRIVAEFARKRITISEIIVAMPSATGRQMRTAVAHCRSSGVPFRTLPGIAELFSGKVSTQIREVSPADLLAREPVTIDGSRIAGKIATESVLVTGGCGSIGSELCRQLARFNPRKLVIFDQAESEMFMLALDLRKRFPTLNLITEIGDICHPRRVKDVMSRHATSVVFHAAAYKHVPLMEENIPEAVENNVIGTYNVAVAASRNKVKNFVLISSDKAVNPTSIMGVTKRIAELLVTAIPLDGNRSAGTFACVRFGNVLGSAGSVIPIFRRQIASGGPVTVTHPEIRRYFMSISEAVQLVLQASTLAEGSDIFVLDMGEPVLVMDLARNMIRLAGLVPDDDIEIRISGLRPGEKLFEELRIDGEDILPTSHPKIKRYRSHPPNLQHLARWLEHLKALLIDGSPETLKDHLLLLVPEYQEPAVTGRHEHTGDPALGTVVSAS